MPDEAVNHLKIADNYLLILPMKSPIIPKSPKFNSCIQSRLLPATFKPHANAEVARGTAFVDRLVRRALAIGGNFGDPAKHGIGQSNRKYMRLEFDAPALAMMRAIKQALDPDDIMNPGKVILGNRKCRYALQPDAYAILPRPSWWCPGRCAARTPDRVGGRLSP